MAGQETCDKLTFWQSARVTWTGAINGKGHGVDRPLVGRRTDPNSMIAVRDRHFPRPDHRQFLAHAPGGQSERHAIARAARIQRQYQTVIVGTAPAQRSPDAERPVVAPDACIGAGGVVEGRVPDQRAITEHPERALWCLGQKPVKCHFPFHLCERTDIRHMLLFLEHAIDIAITD
mgnify:CR=1 FL=1